MSADNQDVYYLVHRDVNIIVPNGELGVEFGPGKIPRIRGTNCLFIDWKQDTLDATRETIRSECPEAQIDTWHMDVMRIPSIQWKRKIAQIKGTASVVVIRYFSWASLNHETPLFHKYVEMIYRILLKAWELLKFDGVICVNPHLKYHKNIAANMGFNVIDENHQGFVLQKQRGRGLHSLEKVNTHCKKFRLQDLSQKIVSLQQLHDTITHSLA